MYHHFFTLSFYASIIVLVFISRYTHALPLYTTDDAQITDNKTCQIEFGQAFFNTHSQSNLSPACSAYNYELSVPVSYAEHKTQYSAQIKHPLYASNQFGIAASVEYQPKQHDLDQYWFLNLPISFYLTPQLQLDSNIGWYQSQGQNKMTWAIAATHDLPYSQKIALEYYKPATSGAEIQMIWSTDLIKDRSRVYVSYGQTIRSSISHWLGLGLSWSFT